MDIVAPDENAMWAILTNLRDDGKDIVEYKEDRRRQVQGSKRAHVREATPDPRCKHMHVIRVACSRVGGCVRGSSWNCFPEAAVPRHSGVYMIPA